MSRPTPRSTPGTKLRYRLIMGLRATRSDLLTLQKYWDRYGAEARPEDNATRVKEAWQVVDQAVKDLRDLRQQLEAHYGQLLVAQQREVDAA